MKSVSHKRDLQKETIPQTEISPWSYNKQENILTKMKHDTCTLQNRVVYWDVLVNCNNFLKVIEQSIHVTSKISSGFLH